LFTGGSHHALRYWEFTGTPFRSGTVSDGGQNPSQPQSYTRDQVDKLLNERYSKLDKTIADLTKERDGLKTSHESLSQRLADVERRREEEEEAKVKDDPDQFDIYRRRRKLKADQAEFEKQVGAFTIRSKRMPMYWRWLKRLRQTRSTRR
jgi:chromosome segregation ATPase